MIEVYFPETQCKKKIAQEMFPWTFSKENFVEHILSCSIPSHYKKHTFNEKRLHIIKFQFPIDGATAAKMFISANNLLQTKVTSGIKFRAFLENAFRLRAFWSLFRQSLDHLLWKINDLKLRFKKFVSVKFLEFKRF